MTTTNIIILLLVHFCADQIFQDKSIQIGKGKDTSMLILHVLFYSMTMIVYAGVISYKTGNDKFMYLFPASCALIHFGVEVCTGHIIDRCFEKNQKRMAVLVSIAEFTSTMILIVLTFKEFI